jgi:hypothetical protein
MTDEATKGDCSVSLIRDNEDGSSDYQFNLSPLEMAALTRLGLITAIKADIEAAKELDPDQDTGTQHD